MTKARSLIWLLTTSVFTLLALAVFTASIVRLYRFGFPETIRAADDRGYLDRGYLFSACILISAGTIVYALLELWRYSRARGSLVPRFLPVAAILFGGVVSVFLLLVSLHRRGPADTRIIPELALPPDDPRLASPEPTPQ